MSGFVAYDGARPVPQRPAAPSIWHALSHRLFFWLWMAALVSNIGTWMQNVGAAWLMITLILPSYLVLTAAWSRPKTAKLGSGVFSRKLSACSSDSQPPTVNG